MSSVCDFADYMTAVSLCQLGGTLLSSQGGMPWRVLPSVEKPLDQILSAQDQLCLRLHVLEIHAARHQSVLPIDLPITSEEGWSSRILHR